MQVLIQQQLQVRRYRVHRVRVNRHPHLAEESRRAHRALLHPATAAALPFPGAEAVATWASRARRA
jgi:hypothetical protein